MYYNIQATASLKPLVRLLTTAVNRTNTTKGYYKGSNKLYK